MIQINNKRCFNLKDILDSFSDDMLRLYTYPLLPERLHSTNGCEAVAKEVDELVVSKHDSSEFVQYACLVKAFFRGDAICGGEVLSSYVRTKLSGLALDNLHERLMAFMPSEEDSSCLSSCADTYGGYFQALSELRNVIFANGSFSDDYQSLSAIRGSSVILGAGVLKADAERKMEEMEAWMAAQKALLRALEAQNMVYVEGGTFRMGSDDSDAYDDEKPVHSVLLPDYYICEHTVTQHEWEEMMGSNPSCFKGANLPVEEVSWYDCVNFCNKLSLKYGLKECYQINGTSVSLLNGGKGGFRLPTESEWEYAARGGNKSRGFKYAGSNNPGDVALYDDNSGSQTHAVCQKKPNELGLYDMSGNIWEWCWDWTGSYPSSSQSNPLGPSSGSFRVFRGGGWDNDARICRVSCRDDNTPGHRFDNLGLRLVLAL